MGLFSKKQETADCSVCNANTDCKALSDGFICKECIEKLKPFINNNIFINWKNFSLQKINQTLEICRVNQERLKIFQKTNDYTDYLEIDSNHQLWKTSSAKNVVFSYSDILDFELLENGEAITKSGLGSAVVGGVLFGGVGAVVGSTVGKKQTKREITEYRIKITTNNLYYPSLYINFLTSGKVKEGSVLYNLNVDSAQKILSVLTQITNSVSNSTSQIQVQNFSVADEILKLKQLLDAGILTETEFENQKKQILNL